MQTLVSLKSVFKDRIFKIPDYQRGYAWRKRQLVDFWEDLVNLPPDRYHYTGLLSLKRVPEREIETEGWTSERWLIEDQGYKPFHIVDGQQRLTTFVIFINEMVNFVRNASENDGKEDAAIYINTLSLKEIQKEYLVVRMPPQFLVNTYKFGYEKDNPSFKYLKHRILGEPDGGSVTETFYTLNLENAKKFFADNLKSYCDKYGFEKVKELFKKATQNFMFNLHEIEDDFDVFVAFETMNNRGKPLSNLELMKNRLIYRTTLYDTDELREDERKILRERINEAWKEVYFQLGRNKQKPLSDDDFLMAHWIMYFNYTRKKGRDYIRFLLDEKFTAQNVFNKIDVDMDAIENIVEVRDQEPDEEQDENGNENGTVKRAKLAANQIADYVQSLQSASVHWHNTFNPLNNPDLSEEEQIWLDRLNRIGIAYFRPLVVASYLRADIKTEERVRLFKEIERFIFIAFRIGRAFSTYRNSEYYRLSKELRIGKVTIDEVCQGLRSRIDDWMNDSTTSPLISFNTYIGRHFNNGGGYYWWNGLNYFLYEYENEKVIKNGNKKIDWTFFVKNEKDQISIEHILPQTATKRYWVDAFEGYSKKEMKYLANSLGNLVPLSKSKNSSLQNDSFPDKKSPTGKTHNGFVDGSHSEIEVASYEDWNAEAILNRGMKLLDFMERRWDFRFVSDQQKKDILFLSFM